MIRLKREEIFKEHTQAADAYTRQQSQTLKKNNMNSSKNNNDNYYCNNNDKFRNFCNDNDKFRSFSSTSQPSHHPLPPSRVVRTSTSTITTPPPAVQSIAQAQFRMLSTSAIISTPPMDEQGNVDMLINTYILIYVHTYSHTYIY